MLLNELPIPAHFDPGRVGQVWRVPYLDRANEAETWAGLHGIRPAHEDSFRVTVIIVDCQNTFCVPGFELFVAGPSGSGAVDDNVRLCEFIYRNLGVISELRPTMDTHSAMQIFHPIFWIDSGGRHPEPHAVIAADDIESGKWQVNPAVAHTIAGGDKTWIEKHALHYTQKLTEGGKYPLIVWPYHSMLGGIGHALVSAVEEACFFYGLARQTRTALELKGDNPLTENYSVLSPEVLDGPDGSPIAQRNTSFISEVLESDLLVVAGQAKSHCVAWSVDDLLAEIRRRDPPLVDRVYLLEDCTSPVVVPGVVDFAPQADAAFERFARAGMHVVRSTDPIDTWPGVAQRLG